MAIGWIPPAFFCKAMNLPPKKTWITTDGHEPAKMQLVNDVWASKRASPLSLQLTRSTKWLGRRPSGPAEEPVGKDRRHLRTSPVVTWRLNAGSGRGTGRRSTAAGGCFSCSFSRFDMRIDGHLLVWTDESDSSTQIAVFDFCRNSRCQARILIPRGFVIETLRLAGFRSLIRHWWCSLFDDASQVVSPSSSRMFCQHWLAKGGKLSPHGNVLRFCGYPLQDILHMCQTVTG